MRRLNGSADGCSHDVSAAGENVESRDIVRWLRKRAGATGRLTGQVEVKGQLITMSKPATGENSPAFAFAMSSISRMRMWLLVVRSRLATCWSMANW